MNMEWTKAVVGVWHDGADIYSTRMFVTADAARAFRAAEVKQKPEAADCEFSVVPIDRPTTSDTVSGLIRDVGKVAESIGAVAATVSNLSERLSALDGRVRGWETDDASTRYSVASLRNSVGQSLDGAMAKIEAVAAAAKTTADLGAQLADAVATLRADHARRLDFLSEGIDAITVRLDKRFDIINGAIEGEARQRRNGINDLERRIGNVENDVSRCQSDVDSHSH